MQRPVIRHAGPGDAAALVALAAAVAAEPEGWLLSDGDWRSVADERRYLKAARNSPDFAVLLAETGNGAVVGRLSIARDLHPASAHVAELGVLVAATARRQGVGTALLAAAEEWARAAGISRIELQVFPHNTPAIRLYERLGYQAEGVRRQRVERAGELSDILAMARLVGPVGPADRG